MRQHNCMLTPNKTQISNMPINKSSFLLDYMSIYIPLNLNSKKDHEPFATSSSQIYF